MKTTKRPIRHGELLLLPTRKRTLKGAKTIDNYVVSHSETGHHHILLGSARVLEREGHDTLVAIDEPTKLTHKKTTDRHEDVTVPKGIFRILKKKEYEPFGEVVREVRD